LLKLGFGHALLNQEANSLNRPYFLIVNGNTTNRKCLKIYVVYTWLHYIQCGHLGKIKSTLVNSF